MPGNLHSTNPPPPYSAAALFITSEQENGDCGAWPNHSLESGRSTDSCYTEQVVAGRRYAVQVQAHARQGSSSAASPNTELQRRFTELGKLTPDFRAPDSKASYRVRVRTIVSYVNKHKELEEFPDVALTMCQKLEDDEKKHMVYTGLSESLKVLPFESGKGLAFAKKLLEHHEKLSPDWQNPTEILSNFLSCSNIRIDQLSSVTLSAKNLEKLEWHLEVIQALYQYRDKIFSRNENIADAGTLVSKVIESLVSCMKEGGMVKGAQKAMKPLVSDTVFSRMLPVLECFPLQDLQGGLGHYEKLLENSSDFLEEDKREPFAFKVFLACESLLKGGLTWSQKTSVIEMLVVLAKQIHTFPSNKKAGWIEKMRGTFLKQWDNVAQSFQKEIIHILRSHAYGLNPAERETHLAMLGEAAGRAGDPALFGQLWINNPAETTHGGREVRGEEQLVHELPETWLPELPEAPPPELS